MTPDPVNPSFEDFGLDPALLAAVRGLGFVRPTPIQVLAIPPLMAGRDVLGAAETGSGKTAAFGLPILHRLLPKARGVTRALVLAPTRELAAQIAEHLDQLSVHTRLRAAPVFGGVGMQPQVEAFRRGVDVLVATPGRLLDHMQHDYARLAGLEILVLDEADRMLDMGFLPDVKRVLMRLPARRQGMLFSATMPAPIVALSRELLRDPVALNIERKSAPARGITHEVYCVPDDLKPDLLAALLKQGAFRSVLAFTRTKHRANRLAELLEKRGVPCVRIHGNRSQTRRTEALAGFKDGTFSVMVATDIAARGIDVTELALVVNVDVPHLPEDYIHRVGRTARVERTGLAVTLVSREEEADLAAIERHLGRRLPRQHLQGFDYQRPAAERFEIPIGVRIAEIRKRKAEERARSREKAARKEEAARERASAEAEREKRQAERTRERADHARRQAERSRGGAARDRLEPDRAAALRARIRAASAAAPSTRAEEPGESAGRPAQGRRRRRRRGRGAGRNPYAT